MKKVNDEAIQIKNYIFSFKDNKLEKNLEKLKEKKI